MQQWRDGNRESSGGALGKKRRWRRDFRPPVPVREPNEVLVAAAVKMPSDHENGRGAPVPTKACSCFVAGWIELGVLELVPITFIRRA